MTKHIASLLCAIAALLLFPGGAAMAQVSDAEHQARLELANDMANMTLSILKDQKTKASDRQDNLKRSFAKVVDINWIAKFVLGNSWRAADEAQRERYTKLYREYLTNMYVSNYAESRDKKITNIKVLGITPSDTDDNRFTARTEIVVFCSDRLKVDYLVAGQQEGGYKIIDVTIEGVSLLATHRAEFSKIAAQGGVDSVIARLETLLDADQGTITLSMK